MDFRPKTFQMSPFSPPHSPAAERNQAPILAVLQALLPAQGTALEIASGTGQHAAHFGAALPGWHWQPTDLQDSHFDAIAAWAAQAGARNVLPARRLDVRLGRWPTDDPAFEAPFNLIYCANMLHIAPWDCCAGLMRGAARHLAPGGQLVTYLGPTSVYYTAAACQVLSIALMIGLRLEPRDVARSVNCPSIALYSSASRCSRGA